MSAIWQLKELYGFHGQACLVKKDDGYYVVSSIYAPFTGPETLVFSSDENGRVTSWIEVAGGRGVTRDEAIAELEGTDLS
jgi:hypothetical protein